MCVIRLYNSSSDAKSAMHYLFKYPGTCDPTKHANALIVFTIEVTGDDGKSVWHVIDFCTRCNKFVWSFKDPDAPSLDAQPITFDSASEFLLNLADTFGVISFAAKAAKDEDFKCSVDLVNQVLKREGSGEKMF